MTPEAMPTIDIPEAKSPLQARAYALLRAIAARDHSRPELVELNGGNEPDTRRALIFLRDHKRVFIMGYTADERQPIYRLGNEKDAPYQRSLPPAPKQFTPRLDPASAALFGRQPV